MADHRMYLPPHRRLTYLEPSRPPTPFPASSSSTLDPSTDHTQGGLFEGTILGLENLRLQSPSASASASETRNGILVESQSVRRGYGRFGAPVPAPPPARSQTTEGRSITALVSTTEHDEDDLDSASTIYSNSTNIARACTVSEVDCLTRPHTPDPLPTREWTSVEIPVAPLPPRPIALAGEPLPLIQRIGQRKWTPGPSHKPKPLAERIGGLYIPPAARLAHHRYEIQSPRDDGKWWQLENLRRQRFNFNFRSNAEADPKAKAKTIAKPASHPGPSRRCLLPPTFSQIAVLYHSLGEKVDTFKIGELEVREGEGISGVEYAGSYKWIEGDEGIPTLAVPAVPDIWDPPKMVGKLTHDKDIKNYEEFPDYASALLPPSLSTLEPLFLSLTSPDILHNIDLVSGRNNLRKLWSALRDSDNHHTSPWRIDVEYINCGDTSGLVILERFEPPQTNQYRHSPNGYRQSYQEATTRKVLDGSDRTPGCNRVISYQFGGLKLLVKFDTPAFSPQKANWTEYESGVTELFDDKTTIADGVSTMDGLDFDDPVYNGQTIRIRHTTLTPPTQEECISIKTKQYNDEFDAEYHYPQMYFSQTPHVVYARHQFGDFKFPILHYDLFNDQVPHHVGKERQETIDKVAAVLRWVVSLTREYRRGLGLVWDGKSFSVCERDKGPELSAPVKEMIMDVRGRDRSVVVGDISIGGLSVASVP